MPGIAKYFQVSPILRPAWRQDLVTSGEAPDTGKAMFFYSSTAVWKRPECCNLQWFVSMVQNKPLGFFMGLTGQAWRHADCILSTPFMQSRHLVTDLVCIMPGIAKYFQVSPILGPAWRHDRNFYANASKGD
jgi:hypothetical protein